MYCGGWYEKPRRTRRGGGSPQVLDLDIKAYPTVENVTRAKISELLGALYTWMQGAVLRDDAGKLGRETLWRAWASVHGESPDMDEIAGETQNTMRDVCVPALQAPRVDGS